MKICSIPNCGRLHEAFGLCAQHNTRRKKWGDARPEQPISRSGSRKGSLNPKWKGGISVMKSGRALVYFPTHPNSRKNGIYVRRAHLIMANHIGRPILKGEVVHHKNCNPADDRIENLELMTISEHRRWHMKNGEAKRMRKIQLSK